MKKISFLFFILFISRAVAGVYTADITGACGVYEDLYARFNPNQYTCNAGYFLPANSAVCDACPSGFSCAGGTYSFSETKNSGLVSSGTITQNISDACAANFPRRLNAVITPNTYVCDSGYFLPANTLGCATCPSGYTCSGGTFSFNEKKNSGLVSTGTKTQNAVKACGVNSTHVLNARFVRNQHECAAGYYMPANTDGCVICSENYYCVGGTYTFNETDAQGITECPDDLPSVAGASSVEQCANAYICNSGYYLPANSVQCTICPANSYCVGGSYTFDENTPQGIVSCTSGLYAPVGMWESAQCGRILHIGDNVVYLRSVKKTTPALHVKVDDTIFYGNMTTSDVVMNSGTDKKLKLQYDGQTYSVYDDTVVP